MENTEHIKFVKPKIKSEDEIRVEGRNMDAIVHMFVDGKYRNYDLSDGSLRYEMASDGIRSAEALLIDIEEQIAADHPCIVYKGKR